MRLFFCTFLLWCTVFLPLQAQRNAKELAKHKKAVARSARNNEAIISLDTLFKAGQPYAVVRRKNQYDYAYQLVSLRGEPLFWTDIETGIPAGYPGVTRNFRVFTFLIDSVAEPAAVPLGFNWTDNDLAYLIFRNGLVDANGLNRANVVSFIESYKHNVPEKDYTLQTLYKPHRDRAKPLYRQNKNTIIQDGVPIATIWHKKLRGTPEEAVRIYNTEGRRFTSFMFMAGARNTLEFDTTVDGRFHKIEVSPEQDPVLEVTAYLVAKGYL